MPLTFVEGDIFLSRARVIAVGFNAAGQREIDPVVGEIAQRYPAALAAFRKRARAGRMPVGGWWLWRETAPWLALLIVREGHAGPTRPRYVEEAAQQIGRDWEREGVASLAIVRLGEPLEWPASREVLIYWLARSALPIAIYEAHRPGIRAPEPWDMAPPSTAP